MLAFYLLVSWSRQVCEVNKNNKNIILLCMQMTQNTVMTMNYSKHNSNNVNIIQNDLLIDPHFSSWQENLHIVSLLEDFLERRLCLCVSTDRQRQKTHCWPAGWPDLPIEGLLVLWQQHVVADTVDTTEILVRTLRLGTLHLVECSWTSDSILTRCSVDRQIATMPPCPSIATLPCHIDSVKHLAYASLESILV